jgi:hypothetical protein
VFDIDDALEHLLADGATAPAVEGVPRHETTRSVAAARVARAAAAEGLLLFHFEHRALLEVPASWQRRADDGALPRWSQGVLPEPKYGAFRHDQGVGSFHPGHRAKWATHELCHGLVGTAWHPGASRLFHATAGRLAELVPVVLWYTLDEIGLRRCPRHTGPLFRAHCPACERAAAEGAGPVDPAAARRQLERARDYVERELAAVAQTRRSGVPVHHVHGSLDLCSDGLAYSAAHGPRLDSPGFAAWAERYLEPTLGGYEALEALEARAVEVFLHLATGRALPERGATRGGWVRQDLSGRVLQGLHGDAEPCAPVWDCLDQDDLEGAIRAYAEAADACGGEHPADVFASGYPLLPGVGRSLEQVEEGLASVVPMTLQLAEDAELDLVEAFVDADPPARVPLGLRFAAWLEGRAVPHVVALARYEAMLRAAGGEADLVALGEGTGWVWAEGVQRWSGPFDPIPWAEAIDAGAVEGRDTDGLLDADAPDEGATGLAMGRAEDGELVLVSIPSDVVERGAEALPDDVRDELLALGLVRHERWGA